MVDKQADRKTGKDDVTKVRASIEVDHANNAGI